MKSRPFLMLAAVALATFAGTSAPASSRAIAYVNAKVVPQKLASTVAALRKHTLAPIVVPPTLDASTFASFDAATAGGYTLYADLEPGCKGTHACGWFTLIAKAAPPNDRTQHDKPISLGRGVTGVLTPSVMNAYPSDTVIEWRLGSTWYSLYVNSHGPEPAGLARSIVANLLTVPQPSTMK